MSSGGKGIVRNRIAHTFAQEVIKMSYNYDSKENHGHGIKGEVYTDSSNLKSEKTNKKHKDKNSYSKKNPPQA